MLLIVAAAQTKRGESAAARQTLASVTPEDLTPELRYTYWLTQAKNNQALKRWHTAADAWKQLAALSQEPDKWGFVYAQADATIQGTDYLNAEKILLQIPESERNGAWHYALAVCATNSGRWKTAEEHLIPLSMGDPSDNYTMRARILLAEKRSEKFLRQQQ
jgi:tetratricopeptide (TPR) repeat protein